MTCWVQYCQLFDDQRPVHSLTHSQFLNDHLINWAVYMYWLLLWFSRISSIDWLDAFLRLSANNYFSPWIMIKALRYRKYIFYFCICALITLRNVLWFCFGYVISLTTHDIAIYNAEISMVLQHCGIDEEHCLCTWKGCFLHNWLSKMIIVSNDNSFFSLCLISEHPLKVLHASKNSNLHELQYSCKHFHTSWMWSAPPSSSVSLYTTIW